MRPVWKITRVLLCFLCLLSGSVHAADIPTTSLFFTPDEVQVVEKLAAKAPRPLADSGDVHLGAVIYYGEGDWVLWLQGSKWTPATEQADLHVLEVHPDAVRLAVAPAPGMALRTIVLKPYQTYQGSTGMVVEGAGLLPASLPSVSR